MAAILEARVQAAAPARSWRRCPHSATASAGNAASPPPVRVERRSEGGKWWDKPGKMYMIYPGAVWFTRPITNSNYISTVDTKRKFLPYPLL